MEVTPRNRQVEEGENTRIKNNPTPNRHGIEKKEDGIDHQRKKHKPVWWLARIMYTQNKSGGRRSFL